MDNLLTRAHYIAQVSDDRVYWHRVVDRIEILVGLREPGNEQELDEVGGFDTLMDLLKGMG
jgi:hypothetical protein